MIPMEKLAHEHGDVLLFLREQLFCIGCRDSAEKIYIAESNSIMNDAYFLGWTHIPKLPEVETDPAKMYTYCASGSAHTVYKPMGGELARLVEVNTCLNPMTASEARSFAYAILAVCDAMEREG